MASLFLNKINPQLMLSLNVKSGICQTRKSWGILKVSSSLGIWKNWQSGGRSAPWEEPKGYDTGIKVWNSLTKRKDPLILRNEKIATWYICGPTVYDSSHIGHASTYVRFDIIRRILENFFDINAMVVLGLTDIDDKLIDGSKETGLPFSQLAWTYELEFDEDMAALNILPLNLKTKVTEHVPQIIDFIASLVEKGDAYTVPSGSVYFDLSRFGGYGKLCRPSECEETSTDEHEKHNKNDFVLWKASKPGEPLWEAPWGNGRPGWHIECSVMASEVFGKKMDIHSGGEDLIFPHHENELAQSCAYHNCSQWANYWMHTGHLYLKGQEDKMSKSLKNVVTISEFLEDYTADQFRILCLLTPYRNRIEYTEETMQKAIHINKQIHNCLHNCDAYIRGNIHSRPINEARLHKVLHNARHNIEKALVDDFNTGQVMENVMELVKELNISIGSRKESGHGPRSPAVISYTSSYLYSILTKLGLQPSKGESELSDSSSKKFGIAMDSVVNLRKVVRNFAIDPPDELTVKDMNADTTEKAAKRKVLSPLLEACDDVRENLKAAKVEITDRGKDSTWRVMSEEV